MSFTHLMLTDWSIHHDCVEKVGIKVRIAIKKRNLAISLVGPELILAQNIFICWIFMKVPRCRFEQIFI